MDNLFVSFVTELNCLWDSICIFRPTTGGAAPVAATELAKE